MLNKEEICVIIGGYPQTHTDSALISLTIESFKRQGYDVCFVSHAPVNHDIQKACKYYIYSDENYLVKFPEPSSLAIFHANVDIHFQTNWGNKMGLHSLAILMNIKNALYLLKNKKYKKFIYAECDVFLNQKDHDTLESKLIESDFMNRDFWLMIEYSVNMILPVTALFGGNIEYFHNVFSQINNEEEYINKCRIANGYSLESLFAALFCIEPSGNGYLLHEKPREIFSSEWLGISTSGIATIPGLKKELSVEVDIVKPKDKTDHLFFVLNFNKKQESINLKFYKDNNLINDLETTTGPIRWWILDIGETKSWKIEVFYKGKLINTLERTTEEVFWNIWSYFELK